jgi:hypothetical protein
MTARARALGGWLLSSGLLAQLASCGSAPSSPSEVDVRGVWGGTPASWQWSATALADGSSWKTAACAGRLDIRSQTGDAFQGSYTLDCPSGRTSQGTISGTVASTGAVAFRLTTQQGWVPGFIPEWFGPACVVAPGPDAYEGTVSGGLIDVRRVQTLDCPAGRQISTIAFVGSR